MLLSKEGSVLDTRHFLRDIDSILLPEAYLWPARSARGNEKKIFLSRTDYEKFLSYLKEALDKFGVRLHGYVLMGNHYHLILETPRANLSSFMHTTPRGTSITL